MYLCEHSVLTNGLLFSKNTVKRAWMHLTEGPGRTEKIKAKMWQEKSRRKRSSREEEKCLRGINRNFSRRCHKLRRAVEEV